MITTGFLLLNLFYGAVGTVIAIPALYAGWRMIDKVMKYDTIAELQKKNVAVAIVVGSVFVAVGHVVASVMAAAIH